MAKQGRNWTLILGAFAVLVIVAHIISFVWFPFLPWLEQREAGEDIVRDQMDSDKALQDYRWFRQQFNDIEAQRNQIQNVYDEEETFHETYGDDPSEWSRTAEIRHGRIHERITGNRQMLERMVAEYNARSEDATSAIWKCHLPYQVDERFAIQGPPGADSPEQPQDEYVAEANADREPPEPSECDGLPESVRTGS